VNGGVEVHVDVGIRIERGVCGMAAADFEIHRRLV
jgi:hypothetical protein